MMKELVAGVLALVVAQIVIVPAAVRADIAPDPVVLRIQGESGALTAAAPDRATFVLRNLGNEPREVFLFRAVARDGSTRVPMEIARVEVDGQAGGRTVHVPGGGSIRVTVHFRMPTHLHNRAAYDIELSVRNEGWGAIDASPAHLARPGNGPAKWAR